MNVLFVCHRFPFPPKRGGKIRPFNIIRHLARNHDVTVLSLVRSSDEASDAAGIAQYCKHYEMVRVNDTLQSLKMIARLPTSLPSSFGFFWSNELARRIDGLASQQRFDLAFVHCSSVARYVEHLRGVTKILDFGDMDSQKWREYATSKPAPINWGYALEARKLEREEARLARRFDMCTATTLAEWETLESYATGAPSDWFPNGVDASHFAPMTAEQERDHNRVVFLGRMDYFPNQECMIRFCDDVMPRLRARRPQASLVIVGANPSVAIQALRKKPGVTVTGSVDDVRPYLASSSVMVAPLGIARGTQNKILEGMAAGVPVVASHVAAGGVDALAPDHFLTATSPDDYVEAILRVLENDAERARLARAGRERVLTHHSWPQSMRRLDSIIERCMSRANPAHPATTAEERVTT